MFKFDRSHISFIIRSTFLRLCHISARRLHRSFRAPLQYCAPLVSKKVSNVLEVRRTPPGPEPLRAPYGIFANYLKSYIFRECLLILGLESAPRRVEWCAVWRPQATSARVPEAVRLHCPDFAFFCTVQHKALAQGAWAPFPHAHDA